MTKTQRQESPAKSSKTPSAFHLYRLRDEVLVEFVKQVKSQIKTAVNLKNPVIINTIPLFLEGLAESLCEECRRETATESSNMAQEHGGERARITHYGPEQIIQEYTILRTVVRDALRKHVALTERDEIVIQKSFDKAIQESMIAYFLVHAHIREQFIATLTHDLRNPIGVIKMASELIIESEAITPEVKNLSVRIARNAARADRMIQDMLDASMVQVGETPAVNIVDGNLEAIVQAAIRDLPEPQRSRLVLDLKTVPGYWDLDALQRSVENLINNAFKYGLDSSPVTVTLRDVHRRAILSVHNQGNPIPAENLESLFQVFRRAESAKASGKKGWGVGLALARTAAERMGGSLSVESSAERGTTFTIDVPCDARPFQNAPTSSGTSSSN